MTTPPSNIHNLWGVNCRERSLSVVVIAEKRKCVVVMQLQEEESWCDSFTLR